MRTLGATGGSDGCVYYLVPRKIRDTCVELGAVPHLKFMRCSRCVDTKRHAKTPSVVVMETLTVNKSNLVRHLLKLYLRQRAQNALRATESAPQSVAHLPRPGGHVGKNDGTKALRASQKKWVFVGAILAQQGVRYESK